MQGPCGSGKSAMPAETHLFVCLKDNYGVLLHDPSTGATLLDTAYAKKTR